MTLKERLGSQVKDCSLRWNGELRMGGGYHVSCVRSSVFWSKFFHGFLEQFCGGVYTDLATPIWHRCNNDIFAARSCAIVIIVLSRMVAPNDDSKLFLC